MKRWLAAALSVFVAHVAYAASDAEQCASAYERGQELRVEKKLGAARAQFLVCARPLCPQVTRDDCAKWLGEVEATLPSLIVEARRAGVAFEDAQVVVDGETIAPRVDGRPLAIDPGKHVVRIQPRECAPRELQISVTSSEPTHVTFDVCSETSIVAPAAKGTTKMPPLASIILGAVGVAALGTFIGFGAVGVSDANTLRNTCYPLCDRSPVEAANRELLAADIALASAIVAFGIAAVVWIVAPRAPARTSVSWRF